MSGHTVELSVDCAGVETAGVVIEIAGERKRQIEFYHNTPAGDDGHDTGALALAASCYALAGTHADDSIAGPPSVWPFDSTWWKPKDARRNLIKAAALIVAEIERLDRRDLDPIDDRLPIPHRSR